MIVINQKKVIESECSVSLLWPVPESRVVDEGSIIGGHVVIPAPRVALQLQEVELDLDHLARGGGDHPGAVGVVEIGIRMDRRPDIINLSSH